jgi:hypothetical protein
MSDSLRSSSPSAPVSQLSAVRLTHANLKTRMYVTKQLVGGFYHSPANKCTHVVLSGGAVFPALESEDEIARLIYGLTPAAASVSPTTASQESNQGPNGGATHD